MTTPNDEQKQSKSGDTDYVNMNDAVQQHHHHHHQQPEARGVGLDPTTLSPYEVQQLRQILNNSGINLYSTIVNSSDNNDGNISRTPTGLTHTSADSVYTEFNETTHAWAVFADDPQRKATKTDRIIGTIIILFQLFTYLLFVLEAIEDYENGTVPVMIAHDTCQASNEMPDGNFQCEAEYTSNFDAAVAFFMLAIFLTPDILQAARAIIKSTATTPNAAASVSTAAFACLAGIEVVCAFLSASIAISYQLYIGEVTDAVEVGVGLLFVRELAARAYQGIRHNGVKQYKTFLMMMALLISCGFLVEWFCEHRFAAARAQRLYKK